MKKLLLLTLFMQIPACFAEAGVPCEKIEYAQLKDSDRKELTKMYCDTMDRVALSAYLEGIEVAIAEEKNALVSRKEMLLMNKDSMSIKDYYAAIREADDKYSTAAQLGWNKEIQALKTYSAKPTSTPIDNGVSNTVNAQGSCLGVGKDISAMLKKKYKAKPPTCN